MGFAAGEAHITAASYFEGIQSETNRTFVNRYKQRYGCDQATNACAETAYFQVYLFARALEQANSMAVDDLRPLVLNSSFEAPQGRVEIDPQSGHANLWTRIGRANRAGQFDLIWESSGTIEPDPFLICCSGRRHTRRSTQASLGPRQRAGTSRVAPSAGPSPSLRSAKGRSRSC